jgi:anti-sigma-K factor RskA
MKNLGLITTAATSLVAAAILAVAAPAAAALQYDSPAIVAMGGDAKAGIDHVAWLDDVSQDVRVPKVDTRVRQSR